MIDTYSLIIGVVLGFAIGVYIWSSRIEKKDRNLEITRKVFSTEKLELVIEKSTELIQEEIKRVKRNLTEEEKNEIIAKCCKEKFCI